MEDKKPDYNFSKRPLNYRPKPEQKEFIITLLEVNAGSQQKVLEHCVTLAMDPTKTITVQIPGKTEIKEVIKEVPKEVIKEVIKEVKVGGDLKLSDGVKAHLEKIKKGKRLGTDAEAIAHAITYTSKNDWL